MGQGDGRIAIPWECGLHLHSPGLYVWKALLPDRPTPFPGVTGRFQSSDFPGRILSGSLLNPQHRKRA